MPPKAIPDRWIPYKACGEVIEGTRIICFKVPLKLSVQKNVREIKKIWDIPTVLADIPKLGAVIDLTNTARYYNPMDFLKANILHRKILMPGRVVPPESSVQKFMNTLDEFLDKNSESLVGVHCTHGLNRTGYMVCRYMRDRMGIPAQEAITKFETARGYKIERDIYRNSILGKPEEKRSVSKEPEVIPVKPRRDDVNYRSPLEYYGDNPNVYSNNCFGNRGGTSFDSRNRFENSNSISFGSRNRFGNSDRPSVGNRNRFGNNDSLSVGNRNSFGNSDRPSVDNRNRFGNNDRPSGGNRNRFENNDCLSVGNRNSFGHNDSPSVGYRNSFRNSDRPYVGNRNHFGNNDGLSVGNSDRPSVDNRNHFGNNDSLSVGNSDRPSVDNRNHFGNNDSLSVSNRNSFRNNVSYNTDSQNRFGNRPKSDTYSERRNANRGRSSSSNVFFSCYTDRYKSGRDFSATSKRDIGKKIVEVEGSVGPRRGTNDNLNRYEDRSRSSNWRRQYDNPRPNV